MPPRRVQTYESEPVPGTRYIVRWETERDVVRYAVMLLTEVEGAWRTVVVFDCSHDHRAMATVRPPRRSAAYLATDRVTKAFVDASLAGEALPFPNGSSVFASDVVTDERIREAHAHGRTVVIVDEHENVTVLPSPDPSLGEREWDRCWSGILTHW